MSRITITPFLRGDAWYARVPRLDAEPVRRPLGVYGNEHRAQAVAVCDFLRWLRGRRESWLLDQLAMGKIKVGAAYTAYVENRIDQFITDARDGVRDVDLQPFVAKWQKELERRKKPNAAGRAKYLRQVRSFIVEGVPFRRSSFTKQRIREWLGGLQAGQTNRYRAALSSFAQFLLLEDVLPTNPVRQVPMAKESEPRTLHLSPADVPRLLDAIAPEYRPLHALMLCTGMEVSAALAVLRRDVDVERGEVYARGTKRATRERTCVVYGRWQPLFKTHVQPAVRGKLPDAKLFPHLTSEGGLDALRLALTATELPAEYRQHDHRHTWAVQAVRDGLALHTIAAQLGHRDAMMVVRVYGRFRPERSDFGHKGTNADTLQVRGGRNA